VKPGAPARGGERACDASSTKNPRLQGDGAHDASSTKSTPIQEDEALDTASSESPPLQGEGLGGDGVRPPSRWERRAGFVPGREGE
jgi:hypothetical protein